MSFENASDELCLAENKKRKHNRNLQYATESEEDSSSSDVRSERDNDTTDTSIRDPDESSDFTDYDYQPEVSQSSEDYYVDKETDSDENDYSKGSNTESESGSNVSVLTDSCDDGGYSPDSDSASSSSSAHCPMKRNKRCTTIRSSSNAIAITIASQRLGKKTVLILERKL